jgi:hypothetical protein
MRIVNYNATFLHSVWQGVATWPFWVWLFLAGVAVLKGRQLVRGWHR